MDNNNCLLDPKAFDEINSDVANLIQKSKITNNKESFCSHIDLLFEGFYKTLDDNLDYTVTNIKEAFNTFNKVEEVNFDDVSNANSKKKKKTKKEKTQSFTKGKEEVDSDLITANNEQVDSTKNNENTELSFDKIHSEVESYIEEACEKFKLIYDLNTKISKSDLKSLFSIDKNGNIYLNRVDKLAYLIKYCKCSMDLSWNRKENVEKISTPNDDEIVLNTNTCYVWFRTNKWFTTSDRSFAVEFKFLTSNIANKNFHIGVHNEYLTHTNMCMCASIDHCIYLRRSGDIISNKTPTNFPSFNYLTKTEARILVLFNCSKKQVYFKVDEESLLGPFSFNSGNKFRVAAGLCSTLNSDSTLTIEKAYYVNI